MTPICERLRATRRVGFTASARDDDEGGIPELPINPDGPEAATLIEQAVEALTEAGDRLLLLAQAEGHGTLMWRTNMRIVEQVRATLASLKGTAKRCEDCGAAHDPDIRCPNYHANMFGGTAKP